MTAHFIRPMLYTCDGPRCKAEAEGTNVRLPEGWREQVVTKEWDHAEAVYAHLCPRCVPPEASA